MKKILSTERYAHFLKLSLAIRILLDTIDCVNNNSCAEKLLQSFVKDIPILYDICFLTYNFHSLLHVHEDAKVHGSLDGISAFKFENHLQKIKRKVRKGGSIAAQVYKRHVESSYHITTETEHEAPTLFGRIKHGKISNVNANGSFFSLKEPDNFCLVQDKLIKITDINNKLTARPPISK